MSPRLAHEPGLSWLGAPIDARPLFVVEQAALIAMLRGLEPADWSREAVGWTVRDLAAHLLGDFYGRLARGRGGHQEGPRLAPGETLEAFIHRINQDWVDALARVSPAALTTPWNWSVGGPPGSSRPPTPALPRSGCRGPASTRRRCGWTAPAT
ncbi:hypothetical protein HOK021_34570 [Streptomyces hygroscopicus]|nr:hypothetical protein HOK021_34570 [Streptomyces hygroscopicus]